MSIIGPRPGLWNQDVLTAERDRYNTYYIRRKKIDLVVKFLEVNT